MLISKERAMPNSKTFEIHPIKALINQEITEGTWLDPFANDKKIATITNDLNKDYDTDYHLEALEFLKMFEADSITGVLFDPPYSPRQIKEVYDSVGIDTTGRKITQSTFWARLKDEIARILVPGGKVICFGWNSNGCGMSRGFEMNRILIVSHGGQHNDTIVTVETKQYSKINLF